MSTTINGEIFVDVLYERRKNGDIQWITADWDSPKYCQLKSRTPEQLKSEVFNSTRVQITIQEVSKSDGIPEKDLELRAKAILAEMGHNQNLPSIRFIGYFLAKLLKQLYSHIYISANGIEKIRESCIHHPMLLMPTHRSYMDFLLMSYVFYNFHLPLPLIAAGLDFLGLKAIRHLLRNCGAFFIRRAFGEDKLYWAIFTEYVQSALRSGEHPIEFFVEGTRSRSAKSLNPKLGLFLAAMELYVTGQASDISVVPISITYDRTLEESLYAFELLGVPKPKESTSGLFKARKILGENFGNIYMTVGDPISMREFCLKSVDRSLHNLQPRFKSALTHHENEVCGHLANHVVKLQQKNMFLSPFPLVALVLSHDLASGAQGVPVDYLSQRVLWLKELVEKAGASVVLTNGSPVPWLFQVIELHSNVISVRPDGLVILTPDLKESQVISPDKNNLVLNEKTTKAALPYMFLYHYGNQALQLLAPMAMVATAILVANGATITEENLFVKFEILQKILQKEFVFENSSSRVDFSFGLRVLRNEMIVTIKEGEVILGRNSQEKLSFLASLLSPFLKAYQVLWMFLLNNSKEIQTTPISQVVRQCQRVLQDELEAKNLSDYRILSLDILNNGMFTLMASGAIKKDKHQDKIVAIPDDVQLFNSIQELGLFLDREDSSASLVPDLSSLPLAKL